MLRLLERRWFLESGTMRWLVMSGVVAAAVLAVVGLVAPDGAGPTTTAATNYRTTVSGIEPATAGVEVRAVEGDGGLELVNRSDRPVTVLGYYSNEPYLRVGGDDGEDGSGGGVYENVRSPSLYIDGGTAPPDAGRDARPEWRRVDGGTAVRWHDHRAHWMGSAEPDEVAAQPDRTHLITSWQVPLLVGDTPTTVRGQLTWVPAPSPWPWYLGAAIAAALVVVVGVGVGVGVGRRRWRAGVLPVAMSGLVASAAVLTAGRWTATTGGFTEHLGILSLPLIALLPAGLGLLVGRNDRRNRLLLVGASITSLGGLFGVSHLSWLSHSQLPTTLGSSVARLAVATALGTAAGALLVVAAQIRALWPTPNPAPPTSGSDPPAADPDAEATTETGGTRRSGEVVPVSGTVEPR